MGTLCQEMPFRPYQQAESHPWTTTPPRRYQCICALDVYKSKHIWVSAGKNMKESRERDCRVYGITLESVLRVSHLCINGIWNQEAMASAPSEGAATTGASSVLAQVLSRDYCPGHVLCQVMRLDTRDGMDQEQWRPIGAEANKWHKMCNPTTWKIMPDVPGRWSTRTSAKYTMSCTIKGAWSQMSKQWGSCPRCQWTWLMEPCTSASGNYACIYMSDKNAFICH